MEHLRPAQNNLLDCKKTAGSFRKCIQQYSRAEPPGTEVSKKTNIYNKSQIYIEYHDYDFSKAAPGQY